MDTETSFSYCGTEGKMDFMSLCGMVLTTEGIVAFTDSKATKRHWMGHMIEDKERRPQKLIYNEEIVIVTTGYNQFKTENGEYKNLENGIQLIIDEYQRTHEGNFFSIDILWIYEKIYKLLEKTLKEDKSSNYLFLIGAKKQTKNGNIYHIYRMHFSHDEHTIEDLQESINSYCYFFIGDDTYCQMLGDIWYEKSYPIDELPQKMKDVLVDVIHINDLTRVYNPVGGEIHTYIFR